MCITAGVGGRGVTATVGEEPPAQAIKRASKSGDFSAIPISVEERAIDVLESSSQ